MKRVICTFASHYMTEGFPRFREQVESMNVFDEIHTICQNDLSKEFMKKWGRYMYPYARGFGYWCWKPHFMLNILESLDEGDLLLYSDVGCFFNPAGREKLLEYIDTAMQHPTGMLSVQSHEPKDNYNGLPETIYYEYEWTKGDIFDYFGVRNDKSFTHTPQFESTIIFFRKCETSIQFLRDWDKAYQDDYSLATDSPSRSPNLEGFIENRHDQSLFSILAKKYGIAKISTNEIFQRDWTLLRDYPITARRDKAYPSKFHYKHRFRLRKLYRFLWKIKYMFKK